MVTEYPKSSDPNKLRSTVAPAALNVECPDVYSGNGGVTNFVDW